MNNPIVIDSIQIPELFNAIVAAVDDQLGDLGMRHPPHIERTLIRANSAISHCVSHPRISPSWKTRRTTSVKSPVRPGHKGSSPPKSFGPPLGGSEHWKLESFLIMPKWNLMGNLDKLSGFKCKGIADHRIRLGHILVQISIHFSSNMALWPP
ncbi:unnamed protein product [Kuraishia capsulata CBS 1993]|uniref:Uncharacterized protein n=1 Tax=Kuraishia capsulata CBS 1993 TaxID=1382522 RepID=W6MRK9_9ASCO|nr:uncharacterized protein KUCA_T00003862001 [Kuraishia capsulata CBS 1993]CDK27882.1 unnamed protein product [Kuraishia capsulata CBS 1993]